MRVTARPVVAAPPTDDAYSLSTVLGGSQDSDDSATQDLPSDDDSAVVLVEAEAVAVTTAAAAAARVPVVAPPPPSPPPPARPPPLLFRVKVRDYRETHLHPGHPHTGDVVVLGKEHSAILGDASIRVRTQGGASVGWVDHAGVVNLGPYVGSDVHTVNATYEHHPYNYKQRDRFGGPEAVVVVQAL